MIAKKQTQDYEQGVKDGKRECYLLLADAYEAAMRAAQRKKVLVLKHLLDEYKNAGH